MEQLIPVINKLQDILGVVGQQLLDLPQICVIGSQSAGKSSVLENIVGRDFLPRGIGICTRRPLVLQLYCTGNGEQVTEETSENGVEWGEFLHLPGQKFFDFSEIRTEIERETDRLSGKNKGVSNKPINLKIYSPYVLNLTLVDLPGITKVPTGDQPADVEQLIINMCYEFISNPNAIILAVTAANQDLVNSEGLKLARAVDPDGVRTIGVLTKVDIMDHGTDCSDVLNNQVVPLRRGYVAVINRSQKDIQDNLPIRQGLVKETKFFHGHPKYRHFQSKCGTTNMARILNQMLMNHIRDVLPDIKARIGKMLFDVNKNIISLGESVDDQSASAKGAALLRILAQFATNFTNKVDGRGNEGMGNEMNELYGGARISYIFNEVFGKRLKVLSPFDGLSDEDIRVAIANANGTRPALFVPEISFDLLVRRQIARLEQPGLDCLDLVQDEMLRMVGQSETIELGRFPGLRDRAMEIVQHLLRNSMAPAQKMISNLILIELAFINTSHPDFIGGKAAMATAHGRKIQQQQHPQAGGPGVPGIPTGPGGAATQYPSSALQQQQQQGGAPSTPAHNSSILPSSSTANTSSGNLGGGGGPGGDQQGGFFGFFQSPNSGKQRGGQAPSASSYPSSSTSHNRDNGNDYNVIKLPQVPEPMRPTHNPSDKEKLETEVIKTLINSYFEIVKKNFTDLVPKAIMRFLVIAFKEALQNELVAQLYNETVLNDLMREAEDIATRRKAYTEMRDLLQGSLEIVNEVRDFQPSAIVT